MKTIAKPARKSKSKSEGFLQFSPALVKLAALNPAPYNPNRMTKSEMEGLKASIRKYGMVLNLVVQKKGMVIIGGHQRLAAVRALCTENKWAVPEEVWATVLDVDDTTAKKLNVALNRHHGQFDNASLGKMLESIELSAEDYLSIGFTEEQVAKAISAVHPADISDDPPDAEARKVGRTYTLTIEFPSAEDREEAKSGISYASKKLGKSPGAMVLEALKIQFADHFKSSSRTKAAV